MIDKSASDPGVQWRPYKGGEAESEFCRHPSVPSLRYLLSPHERIFR